MRQTFIYLVAICNIRGKHDNNNKEDGTRNMDEDVKNGNTNKTHTMEEVNE